MVFLFAILSTYKSSHTKREIGWSKLCVNQVFIFLSQKKVKEYNYALAKDVFWSNYFWSLFLYHLIFSNIMGRWQKLVLFEFIIGLKRQNVWSDLFVFLLVQGNTIWKVLREQNKSQDETSNRSRMSFTQKSSHYILTFSLVSTYTFQKFNICILIPKRVLSYGIRITGIKIRCCKYVLNNRAA